MKLEPELKRAEIVALVLLAGNHPRGSTARVRLEEAAFSKARALEAGVR